MRYEQVDTNDQLTCKGRWSTTPLPNKSEVGPGENYWLPLVRTTSGAGEIAEDQPYVVDLPNQQVVWETVLRSETTQETEDKAEGFFQRVIAQDKNAAVILLTLRDYAVQQGATVQQANTWLKTTVKGHYKDLS